METYIQQKEFHQLESIILCSECRNNDVKSMTVSVLINKGGVDSIADTSKFDF